MAGTPGRSGRRPGARGKATIEREARAKAGTLAALTSGVMPLDIMLTVARGGAAAKRITARQLNAAIAAAPYLHPRLTAVGAGSLSDLERMTDEELRRERDELAAARSRDPAGASSEGM